MGGPKLLFHDVEMPVSATTSKANVPTPEQLYVDKEIFSQATASLVLALLSFLSCIGGLLLAPYAVYRGATALRMICEHQEGQIYWGIAVAGQTLAILALALYGLAILFFVLSKILP